MTSFKYTLVVALIAIVVNSGRATVPVQFYAPTISTEALVWPKYDEQQQPIDGHAQYAFAYGVDDSVTGDSKSHYEQRDGDVVRGEYSLIDADGYRRIVQYTADAVNGFNAVVRREPLTAPAGYDYTPPAARFAAPIVELA